jgi:D-alanyl-D-alanine carboxypeptidase/D-alanyl-D-alanine-endopeptidase (penicillin-binding protein 4)
MRFWWQPLAAFAAGVISTSLVLSGRPLPADWFGAREQPRAAAPEPIAPRAAPVPSAPPFDVELSERGASPAPQSLPAPGSALAPPAPSVAVQVPVEGAQRLRQRLESLDRRAAGAPLRAVDPRLQAALEAEVAKGLEAARRDSRGQAHAGNCTVAFQVVDAGSGAVVAERRADTWLEPASNLKLVTTLVALLALGPEHQFRTPVEALGPLRDGTLEGDLLVRAGGDPLYARGDPDHARTRLGELARAVRAAGVERVRGELLLELGDYPAPGPAQGWPESPSSWTGSYGFVAGLTANAGLLDLRFVAGGGGATLVTVAPEPCALDAAIRVRAVAADRNDVRIGLYDGSRRLMIDGELGPVGREFLRDLRHPAPTELFAALWRRALLDAGVTLEGGTREVRGSAPGRELAELRTPWTSLLEAINADSLNSVADAVFLELGAEFGGAPTREASRGVVAEVLASLAVPTGGFVQIGGSGLSRDNRISAALLVQLLRQALGLDPELRELFLRSLAVAGESGTLADRLRDSPARGRVRAKTGFIRGASALSGYAETLDGRTLVFSLLVNYPRLDGLNNSAWKPMHDQLVEVLVRSSGAAGPDEWRR